MQVDFLDRCHYSGLRFFGVLLFGYSLVGCASSESQPPEFVTPKPVMPSAAQSTKQRPIRIIIYFQRPTADSKQLTSAISEACNCQPVFFRRYLDDALIYEITLPQDETFVALQKQLMLSAASLGIKAVEQDRVMRIQ